jgi:hypothetical protein
LRKTFDKVPAGVNFTVIMDCCHSGTNTRAINPPDAPVLERYLPSPWDLVAAESGRELTGKVGGIVPKHRTISKEKDVVVADIGEVLIAGCRDTQTSADAYISGSYNGALTYYLVKAIQEKKGKPYRELHRRTKIAAQSSCDQVPTAEPKANFDQPFLAAAVTLGSAPKGLFFKLILTRE